MAAEQKLPQSQPAVDIDPGDAYWYGIEMSRMVLDFDAPSPAAIREALRSIVGETVLASWIDPSRPAWIPVTSDTVDEWLDQVVVGFSEAVVDPQRAIELQGGPLDRVPFRLLVGPRWISLHEDHVFGDGWTSFTFMAHVLQVAQGAVPALPLPWTEAPRSRRAARSALQAGKRAAAVARAWLRRSELRGGPYEPAHHFSDATQPSILYRSSPVGFSDQLRELRDRSFAGASIAGMTLAGLRRAITTHLAQPRPGTEVLFNTRSGSATDAMGNYSIGLFLSTEDDFDPLAVSRAMAATRKSGLADVAIAAGRWRRPSRGEDRLVAAPTGAPRLTLSFTPRHGPISNIPGVNDQTVFCLATVPNGPETITITVLELADRLCLNLSFYEQTWRRENLEAAVDEFFKAPESALIGGRR